MTRALMQVTVVVPTYHRPDQLERAVRSILRQSRRPLEILITAHSGDRGAALITTRLRPEASEVQIDLILLTSPQDSMLDRHNRAIAAARGSVVAFLDDDAVAPEQWVEMLVSGYADSRVGAVGGRDLVMRDGVPWRPAATRVGAVSWFGRLHGNHHSETNGLRTVAFLKGCNSSYRAQVLVPLDGNLSGPVPYGYEIDLGLTLKSEGWLLLFDPALTVNHYSSTDMDSRGSKTAWVTNHNQTYVLLKHLSWPRRIAFLIYTLGLGDRSTIGIARVPNALIREGWPAVAVTAHFAGKAAGVRTFLRSRRAVTRHRVARYTGPE